MTIRTATLNDLDEITAVEALCFPAAEAAPRESFEKRLEYFPDRFWLAEEDGKLVGFLNGFLSEQQTITDEMYDHAEQHCPDGGYQGIFGLDTRPGWGHRGIASALMNHVIGQCRAEGRKGLFLTCKQELIPFYERFGYRNQGVSESVHGGVVWYDMLLEL